MSDRGGLTRTCIYCGVPIPGGVACRSHAPLAAVDPYVGGLRRSALEEELSVPLPWPEGEAEDDGGEE